LAAAPGTVWGAGQRSITVTYDFDEVQVEEAEAAGKYARVVIPGCHQLGRVGEPVLPFRTARVLLPPGYKVEKARAKLLKATVSIMLESPVEFGRTPIPFGKDRLRALARAARDKPNPKIYGSGAPYPSTRTQLLSVQRLRGYNIALVRLFPVQYVPRRNRLIFCRRMRLTLELSRQPVTPGALPVPRRGGAHVARVASFVDNPDMLGEYDASTPGNGLAPQPAGAAQALSAESYDYLLITSNALVSSFDPLVNQKLADGLSVKTETTENIYAKYAGTDNPERIRNFIKDAYTNWNIQYVLLAGDASVVPYRGAYAYTAGNTENNMPTDLYYSCLDGSWNANGNTSLWGEPTDGEGGGDVDLLGEVYVGRAPVDTTDEVTTFVNKVVSYEQSGTANRDNALFLGEFLGPEGYGGIGYQGGAALDKLLPYFGAYTVDWLDDRYHNSPQWFTADCIAALNQSPHIVAHVGHGNQTEVMRMGRADVDSLTNQHLFLVNSMACDSGAFDYSDCIAEDFSKRNAHAAFAVIMNTRHGWFSEMRPWKWSGQFQQTFFDRLLSQGIINVGLALQLSKHDMIGYVETSGDMTYRWCYFEITLFGDPHTALKPATSTMTLNAKSFDATPSVDDYFSGVTITVTPAPDGATPFSRAYSNGATVTLTAPATHGDLSFSHWKLDGLDQDPGLAELSVTMDDDHTAVAIYQGQALVIDMEVFQPGTSLLNPTGPGPRTLTILSINMPGDPGTDEIAITIGGGQWLHFVADGNGNVDVYTNGAAAEWHTAAQWAGMRIRGLTPGTTYDFQGKSRAGPGEPESELIDVGSYLTNIERDVDRNDTVANTDQAFARDAVLSAAEIGQPGKAWATDVNDSRTTSVFDVTLIRNRILGID